MAAAPYCGRPQGLPGTRSTRTPPEASCCCPPVRQPQLHLLSWRPDRPWYGGPARGGQAHTFRTATTDESRIHNDVRLRTSHSLPHKAGLTLRWRRCRSLQALCWGPKLHRGQSVLHLPVAGRRGQASGGGAGHAMLERCVGCLGRCALCLGRCALCLGRARGSAPLTLPSGREMRVHAPGRGGAAPGPGPPPPPRRPRCWTPAPSGRLPPAAAAAAAVPPPPALPVPAVPQPVWPPLPAGPVTRLPAAGFALPTPALWADWTDRRSRRCAGGRMPLPLPPLQCWTGGGGGGSGGSHAGHPRAGNLLQRLMLPLVHALVEMRRCLGQDTPLVSGQWPLPVPEHSVAPLVN